MAVLSPPFRVSYPNVFRPRKNDLNGKDEYTVCALFAKDADLSALKAEAKKVLEKKFGPDQAQWPANLRSPFRDQKEKAKLVDGKQVLPAGHEPGAMFLNLKSSQRPAVVNERVETIINESDFYAGCYARATINPYYYDQKGNKGVAFGLNNIQKVKDGDPLSGRARPEEDFAPIEGAQSGGSSNDLFG